MKNNSSGEKTKKIRVTKESQLLLHMEVVVETMWPALSVAFSKNNFFLNPKKTILFYNLFGTDKRLSENKKM
jgi:hypothetical protein